MSWERLRRDVFRRDGGRCQVCFASVKEDGEWHLGHLVDRYHYGTDDPDNVVVMCPRCNFTKPMTRERGESDAWLEDERRKALTGQEINADWRPLWRLQTGSHGVGKDRRPDR